MRILLLASLLFSAFSYGQDSTIALSKYEKFSAGTGHMYKEETIDIGKVRTTWIAVSKATDMENAASVRTIKVIQNNPETGKCTIYIDMDEADGLCKALEYYLVVMKDKPKYLPVYSYSTSNDVVAICNLNQGPYGQGWHVYLAQFYQGRRSRVLGSAIELRVKDVDDLIAFIKKAKETVF